MAIGTFANSASGSSVRTKLNAAITAIDGLLVNNFAATVAPTVTDDSAAGYAVGSSWLIPTTGDMWRCYSASAGAAKWVKIDSADFDSYKVGNNYSLFGLPVPAAGASASANNLRLAYGVIKQRVTFSAFVMRVTTAGTNMALAIYKSAAGKPTGLPIAKTASFAVTSATTFSPVPDAGNVTLEPGSYWIGGMGDAAVTAIGYSAPQLMLNAVGTQVAADLTLTASQSQGLLLANTFANGFPDLTGVSAASFSEVKGAMIPFVGITVVSVP